jgi:hypothetical protein
MGVCLQYPEKTGPISRVALTTHDTPVTEVCNGMCQIKMGFYADQ